MPNSSARCLAAAAAALALALPAGAEPAAAPPGARDLEKGTFEPDRAYYDSVWFELADEPEHHFVEALEELRKGDLADAADHIRRGSTFLKVEARRPAETAQGGADPAADPLMDAYRELRFLAEAVEQGRVEDAGLLDHHFAHAHEELALHHLALARSLWRPEADAATRSAVGRHLGGAVLHVQRGLTWARDEPRRGEQPLHEANLVAEILQGDLEPGATDERVAKAFATVEDEIVRLRDARGPEPSLAGSREEAAGG